MPCALLYLPAWPCECPALVRSFSSDPAAPALQETESRVARGAVAHLLTPPHRVSVVLACLQQQQQQQQQQKQKQQQKQQQQQRQQVQNPHNMHAPTVHFPLPIRGGATLLPPAPVPPTRVAEPRAEAYSLAMRSRETAFTSTSLGDRLFACGNGECVIDPPTCRAGQSSEARKGGAGRNGGALLARSE